MSSLDRLVCFARVKSFVLRDKGVSSFCLTSSPLMDKFEESLMPLLGSGALGLEGALLEGFELADPFLVGPSKEFDEACERWCL